MVSGPIPPYNNPPIDPQFYKPRSYDISAISLGITTTITTDVDHDYVIGQEVRLIIPPTFGTRELNGVTGFVIAIPADDEVVLNIYSIGMNQFIASSVPNKAQILAIGNINTGSINASGRFITATFIPGSFQNISPG